MASLEIVMKTESKIASEKKGEPRIVGLAITHTGSVPGQVRPANSL